MSIPAGMQPRLYQYEAMEAAKDQNSIIRMDTGTGKTLVAVMVIRHITSTPAPADAPPKLVVFLSPGVDLVRQQARTIQQQTNLRVKSFVGEDSRRSVTHPDAPPVSLKMQFWEREVWIEEFKDVDVVVLTPQIWLNGLDHAYWDLSRVSLLVFDEAHHARRRHPYNLIMSQHYHTAKAKGGMSLPRILGMTASPVWKPEKVLKSIQELEANLDAKLFEIKVNQADVLNAAPRPKQTCIQYGAAPQFEETSFETQLRALQVELQKELQWDESTWARVEVTKQDLGPLASDIFLSHLLAAHAHPTRIQFSRIPTIIASKLEAIYSALVSYIATEPLTDRNSTPHLRALIEVLADFKGRPDFHSMVFVAQRNHAKVMVDLLHKAEQLSGWVRADYLVGHGGTEQEGRGHGMDAKQQDEKVRKFRTSETNVLVATSVAEEGLDFPTCSVVVRFNAVKTMTSFIQSRGRARAEDSYLFVLAARDSDDVDTYLKFEQGEAGLTELYGEHESSEFTTDDYLDLHLPTFQVDSGATLTHHRAISLLSEACALLPTDAYAPVQHPKYAIEGNGTLWTATVRILMIVCMGAHRVFRGETMRTKGAAKQSAAFRVCRELYQTGGLDEYLLPPRIVTRGGGGRDADGGRVDSTKVPESVLVRSKNVFGNLKSSAATVFLLTLEVFDGLETLAIGLVTASPLESFVGGKLFPADPSREIICRIASREELKLVGEDQQQALLQLESFNRQVLRLVVNPRLANEPLDVLWAPLLPAGAGIDWARVAHPFQSIPPTGPPTDSLVVVPSRRIRTSITTFVQVRSDVTTLSPSEAIEVEPDKKDVKCLRRSPEYYKYVSRAFNYDECSSTTPDSILQVETRPSDIPNLVARPAVAPAPHVPRLAHYPSKMCRVTSLPFEFFDLIRMTPSVMRLLHDTVRTQAVIVDFDLPPIHVPLLIKALTPPSTAIGYDYQYLETLGDSVLKLLTTVHIYLDNPTLDEGRMGPLRANSIDNQFLRTRSLKSGYVRAVLSEPFRTRTWIPSTSDDARRVDDGQFVERLVKRRTLSDTMESTLGAAYLTGGVPMALATGHQLGLCFGGTEPWGARPSAPLIVASGTSTPSGLREIEEKLEYKFNDVRLLQQALTHRSYGAAETHCYEREEHLGDAVLDFWATERLFALFPESTPRKLTFLRGLLVNNATLAFLSVHVLALHRSLLHGSAALEIAIKVAAAELEPTTSTDPASETQEPAAFTTASVLDELTWMWDPPKVLGDILEAVLGAIFVDDGLRLVEVFRVLDSVYKDITPLLQNIEKRDPYSKLLMEVQSRHCKEIKIKVIPTADPKGTNPLYKAITTFHGGRPLATRTSSSKAVARQLAARDTLEFLQSPAGDALFVECTCAADEARERAALAAAADPDLASDVEDALGVATADAVVDLEGNGTEDEAEEVPIDSTSRVREY